MSIEIAKDHEVYDSNNSNKIVYISLLFQKLNKLIVYLTFKTRLAFNPLKKVFTKTSIIYHFDSKSYF